MVTSESGDFPISPADWPHPGEQVGKSGIDRERESGNHSLPFVRSCRIDSVAAFFRGDPLLAEIFQQFVRFTGVGVVSAIGHYGLLIALVQGLAADAVLASAAGALLGAAINYALNYRFTFRSRKQHRESLLKFAIVATVGLGLNTAFMWVGVDLLQAHYLLAQLVTTGLVLLWSFTGNRFWTFRTCSLD